jgi:acetoin utilization protein AcuB
MAATLSGMKNLPAMKIMNTPLVTVESAEPLSSALRLMEQHRVHHLLVVERGRMVGILSSADLLKLALLRRPEEGASTASESLGMLVRDVMQSRVAVVRENSSLKEVARALSLGGFHALPILAVDDTPVGIVTSSDLIGLLIDQIECDSPGAATAVSAPQESRYAAPPELLEVLRAAEVFLRSGESGQQHARLTRAVERARECAF